MPAYTVQDMHLQPWIFLAINVKVKEDKLKEMISTLFIFSETKNIGNGTSITYNILICYVHF